MEDFPQSERIPLGQRLKRVGLYVLQELLVSDAPDTIRNQRLAVNHLEREIQQGLPPSAEPGE